MMKCTKCFLPVILSIIELFRCHLQCFKKHLVSCNLLEIKAHATFVQGTSVSI